MAFLRRASFSTPRSAAKDLSQWIAGRSVNLFGGILVVVALAMPATAAGSEPIYDEGDPPFEAPLTLYDPLAVEATSVRLDWSSPPNRTPSGYRVYVRESGSESEFLQRFGSSPATVTGLAPETTYEFQVVAYFPDGRETQSSNTVTATTKTATTESSALTLYPPITVGTTSVALDWSSEPTGARLGYRVSVRPAGGAESSRDFAVSEGTVTGLTPDTTYDFTVVAYFADGSESERSNTVTVRTNGIGPAPLTLYAPLSVGETSVQLDWSPEPTGTRAGYRVYVRPAGGAESVQEFATSAGTVTGLTPGTAYAFEVVASFADSTETPRSNTVTATTLDSPLDCLTWARSAFPSSCWRPFARTSVFNRAVPSNPRLDPNSANIVATIMGWAAEDNYAPQNIDAMSVYGHPTYFSSSADRVLTIHCTVYACSEIEGMDVHVPAEAVPTGGSDRHIAIVQPDGSRIIDLWQATTPPLFGVWNVSSGGGSRLDGDGLVADVNGDGLVGSAQATAARWALAAGMIRAAELESGRIHHSLFATVECVNGRVWPALGEARQCSDIGVPMDNAPRNGDWLWLDMTAAEIDALRYENGDPLHPSMRVILKGLAEYGTRIGDTGAYSLAEHENQSMYTAFGLANPMQALGDAEGWPLYDGRRLLRFRDLPSWIWTERLRVLAPCESSGSC